MNAIAARLPEKFDPLVLADGRTVLPDIPGEDSNAPVTISDITPAAQYRPTARRSFQDFSGDPNTLKGVAVIFTFTALGLSDTEIAESLSIDRERVEAIRDSPAYTEIFDHMLNEFVNINSGLVQARIQRYSHAAVTQIGHLMSNAGKEEVRLSASKDILDRAGQRPQDAKDAKNATGQELRIRITKTDGTEVDIGV